MARVLPFLLCCAGMYLTLGVIQVIVGFLVQDRLDVTDDRAGLLTGLALLVAGAGWSSPRRSSCRADAHR